MNERQKENLPPLDNEVEEFIRKEKRKIISIINDLENEYRSISI